MLSLFYLSRSLIVTNAAIQRLLRVPIDHVGLHGFHGVASEVAIDTLVYADIVHQKVPWDFELLDVFLAALAHNRRHVRMFILQVGHERIQNAVFGIAD